MKTLALLSAWALLASTLMCNALASSAYTCTTYANGSDDTGFAAINNKGQVLGAWSGSDGVTHAFLRNVDGSITPLVSPSGSDEFNPVAINDLGQILGAIPGQKQASEFILNRDGSFKEIAPPAAPPGYTYDSSYFSGFNDKGELAGEMVVSSPDSVDLDFISSEARTGGTE